MKYLYLIFRLFFSPKPRIRQCFHSWIRAEVMKSYEAAGDALPIKIYFVLQCEKCGDMKRVLND